MKSLDSEISFEVPAKSLWVTPILDTDVALRLRIAQANGEYEAQVAAEDFEQATVPGVGQVWVNKYPITLRLRIKFSANGS